MDERMGRVISRNNLISPWRKKRLVDFVLRNQRLSFKMYACNYFNTDATIPANQMLAIHAVIDEVDGN